MLHVVQIEQREDVAMLVRGVDDHLWPLVRRFSAGDRKIYLAGAVLLADIGAVTLSAQFTHWYRFGAASLHDNHLLITALGAIAFINLMQVCGSYRPGNAEIWQSQIGPALAVWGTVGFGIAALAYALKISDEMSRLWIGLWFVLGGTLLVFIRLAAGAVAFRWRTAGMLRPRIAVIGPRPRIDKISNLLNAQSDANVDVLAIVDDGPGQTDDSVSRIFHELAWFARFNTLDEILVAPAHAPMPHIQALTRRLRTLAVNVRVFPDVFDSLAPTVKVTTVCGLPVLSVSEQPLAGWMRVAKRAEDLALATACILIAAPIMVLAALAIKLDSSGPVLFCQTRYGFNGNRICVYKFRTMHHSPLDDPGAVQARRNDLRVTRVGRLLRCTSIDEVPQLFNVLLGDMSLVGPRPHPLALDERFASIIDEYLARHRVKPGITGWAQVKGLRGETETVDKMRARVEHDLFYIQNWSVAFDLKIILLTLFAVFSAENAY